jgi:TonB-dependent SusC/RagA subfamily outer membrane receptor
MSEWITSLKPILKEFVKASKGNPNPYFWKDMVKKSDPDKLVGGGCDFRKPTQLDGWILKFFPDENGVTLDQVAHTESMPSERVYVDFKYQIIDINDGSVKLETPLQLIAGFIGTEVDEETHALTPKMGWVVRQMESDDVILKKLQAKDNDLFSDGIHLRVRRVPDYLSDLQHVKRLRLDFTHEVELPDWFYNLQVDELTIRGKMSRELQDSVRKHFPRVVFQIPPNSNDDEPLIIVDGAIFKGKLSDIKPADIKTKTVLKDAVATAVYGTQGANGVIEITTKGKKK